MSGLHVILAGHAGSGRDGRTGDRAKRTDTSDGSAMISAGHVKNPNWCVHQLELGPDGGPQHDCLAYENQLRDQRRCPPIESELR